MKPVLKISIFSNTRWLFVAIRKTVNSSQMQKSHWPSHTHSFFFSYALLKLILNILLYVWPCDYKINLPLGQIHLTCLRNNQEAWLVCCTIFFSGLDEGMAVPSCPEANICHLCSTRPKALNSTEIRSALTSCSKLWFLLVEELGTALGVSLAVSLGDTLPGECQAQCWENTLCSLC